MLGVREIRVTEAALQAFMMASAQLPRRDRDV
jgi:hypothetical protein